MRRSHLLTSYVIVLSFLAFLVCLVCLVLAIPTTLAQATPAPRARELDRVEDSGRMAAYETGDTHEPGTRDPFDDTAFFDVGIYRHRDTTAGTLAVKTLYVPMRVGLDMLVGHHFQLRGRFGIAGAVESSTGGGVDEQTRTFRAGNLALGGYYARGDDGATPWTVGVGGQLVAPTANYDADTDAERDAVAGSAAVHGLEDAWLFLPKTLTIVPGAYARVAHGPIFANARLDLGLGIATDGGDRAHTFQMRLEAGYRGGESLRVGVGYTNVVAFGSAAPSDASQGALRVFFRADIKLLTVGFELVMNLDDPYGFAFDGGIWGLVSTVGISL